MIYAIYVPPKSVYSGCKKGVFHGYYHASASLQVGDLIRTQWGFYRVEEPVALPLGIPGVFAVEVGIEYTFGQRRVVMGTDEFLACGGRSLGFPITFRKQGGPVPEFLEKEVKA